MNHYLGRQLKATFRRGRRCEPLNQGEIGESAGNFCSLSLAKDLQTNKATVLRVTMEYSRNWPPMRW